MPLTMRMHPRRYRNPTNVIGVVGRSKSTASRGKAASVPNRRRKEYISERIVRFFSTDGQGKG
jgi:hypothetical protein